MSKLTICNCISRMGSWQCIGFRVSEARSAWVLALSWRRYSESDRDRRSVDVSGLFGSGDSFFGFSDFRINFLYKRVRRIVFHESWVRLSCIASKLDFSWSKRTFGEIEDSVVEAREGVTLICALMFSMRWLLA